MIEDLAGIRFHEPDNMFEQHAFTDTAFSDDGRNLPLANVQIGAIEDLKVAKLLGDVFELYEWMFHNPYSKKEVST